MSKTVETVRDKLQKGVIALCSQHRVNAVLYTSSFGNLDANYAYLDLFEIDAHENLKLMPFDIYVKVVDYPNIMQQFRQRHRWDLYHLMLYAFEPARISEGLAQSGVAIGFFKKFDELHMWTFLIRGGKVEALTLSRIS